MGNFMKIAGSRRIESLSCSYWRKGVIMSNVKVASSERK